MNRSSYGRAISSTSSSSRSGSSSSRWSPTSGDLKIVGYAHFGHGGRATSQRASDHLRHIGEDRLTLSRARIYRQATDELLDTAPFVVVNLEPGRRDLRPRRPRDPDGRRGRRAGRRLMPEALYSVDLLLPTARFAFWTDGERVEVLPEHRSPEGYVAYEELAAARTVVGMTTFPNTVLLRGAKTILVDPGMHLAERAGHQRPSRRATWPWPTSTSSPSPTPTSTTPAPAPTCPGQVVLHELELGDPDRPMVAGILPARAAAAARRATRASSNRASPGRARRGTPRAASASASQTAEGLVVLAGDTIGPLRADFERVVAGVGRRPRPGA